MPRGAQEEVDEERGDRANERTLHARADEREPKKQLAAGSSKPASVNDARLHNRTQVSGQSDIRYKVMQLPFTTLHPFPQQRRPTSQRKKPMLFRAVVKGQPSLRW